MSSLYGGTVSDTDLAWILPDLSSGILWGCGALIFLGGVFMSASGAGGGAVFVTVFTSLGGLSAHQAIPLSKFTILLGSLVVFLLNTVFKGKTNFIDFQLVRSIVPMCLAGTLVGVLVNTVTSDRVLMILLTVILILILLQTSKMAYDKRRSTSTGPTSGTSSTILSQQDDDPLLPNRISSKKKNLIMTSLIPVVVICGVFTKVSYVSTAGIVILYIIPICACVAVSIWFAKTSANPSVFDESILGIVGFISGFISGLVGIGGGLMIAPFLLHKGVEPTVAVVVSSTVVLFASLSTALQYVFLDRVAIVVGLVLSIFSIAAGIVAVGMIRFIAKQNERQFFVYVLVVIASATSTVLAIIKAVQS
jgi:uncharacterized membrane protein YfcA